MIKFLTKSQFLTIYEKKLLDPLWQRKKNYIQIRDQFTCQRCGDKTNTLDVHHRHYLQNRDPWDYPDQLLVLLCRDCHKEEEKFADMGKDLFETMHYWGFFNTEIRDILNKLIQERIEKSNTNGS